MVRENSPPLIGNHLKMSFVSTTKSFVRVRLSKIDDDDDGEEEAPTDVLSFSLILDATC